MPTDTETQVRDLVAAWTHTGDSAVSDQLRREVATLCVPAVSEAVRKVFRPLGDSADDLDAIGQLVFFELLAEHMSRFDTTKVVTLTSGRAGTFAGWILYACPGWQSAVRRELEKAGDNSGMHRSDGQMMRIYHGCRERFEAENQRSWTSEEARTTIWEYMLGAKRAHYAAEHPDWTSAQVDAAAQARITKDGLARAINELDEVIRLAEARKMASLDAPVAEGSETTLADTLTDTVHEDTETGAASDWARISVLGMSRKDARVVARHLDNPEENPAPDPRLLTAAQANLGNPLAQFVILGGVENQFATHRDEPRVELGARAQLLSANLL